MNEELDTLIGEAVDLSYDDGHHRGYNEGWIAGYRNALETVKTGIEEQLLELDNLLKGPRDE